MAGSTGQPTYSWFPFAGHKAQAGAVWARGNSSAMLGMGYIENDNADQNAYLERDFYLDKVTWKYCHVGRKDPNNGILTLNFNGVSQGTIDLYSAATTENNYSEITGITVTTAGVKTVQTIAATKNASSTAYRLWFSGESLIATSQVGASTPSGTDTPGFTWEWIPWMGSKANTGWDTRTQGSSRLSGGFLLSGGAQNAEVSCDAWLDAGTHKYAQIHHTFDNVGIYSVQLDAVEKGTIDGFAASPGVQNTYTELTGIAVTAGVKTFSLKMATKNALSISYNGNTGSSKWIRTGA